MDLALPKTRCSHGDHCIRLVVGYLFAAECVRLAARTIHCIIFARLRKEALRSKANGMYIESIR